MAELSRNFTAGKMNKVVDERLVPNGEYIDAMNVRMGSTEQSEIGVIENTKGNIELTTLKYIDGTTLSSRARCIGAYEDGANETLYWFVHDPDFTVGPTGKLDLIVSYNVYTEILTYHIISINDGSNAFTTLNFNPLYLITGINLIGDLLFFTDDYNPPRCINVNKNYNNPVANVDYGGLPDILKERLLVIKKPPTQSPDIEPYITAGQENFMEDRFICFAYRYRYDDGEYSATSQFSEPSFIPNTFNFSPTSYLNEGMVNAYNACTINFNTGGPLVKEIDLLFKEASGNIIRVIEKLNKQEQGWSDYETKQYQFSNNKIFTILPEQELLRLYDNVPRFAKAQTIMGNRLMYGNYVEGYDLVDLYGAPIKLEYTTQLISENINLINLNDEVSNGLYFLNISHIVNDCIFTIDLSNQQLKEGGILNIKFNFEHESFTGDTPFPTETTANEFVVFSFQLKRDYVSVHDLALSPEFQDAVGTISNIKPVYSPDPLVETSCDGVTFTDKFNCIIPNNLDAYQKVGSGINGLGEPIKIIIYYSIGSENKISFQIPAMKYVDDPIIPTKNVYEYYKVLAVTASYQDIGNTQSLHSNRDYEIGIVYMDEFNRSTTALVSPNNTVHVPCGNAEYKNSIKVTIPTEQLAPAWATRYKFVIKPDQENYETIYSNIYFNDLESNNTFFLLEGENARKVEIGDRLIVKSDSTGPLTTCAYATVLDKQVYAADSVVPTLADPQPAGVYMKINATEFSAIYDELSVIPLGKHYSALYTDPSLLYVYPKIKYGMNIYNPTSLSWEDFDIPQGSKIDLKIRFKRKSDYCYDNREYTLYKLLTSTSNYANMKEWWDGDNLSYVITQGIADITAGDCAMNNVYIQTLASNDSDIPQSNCTNYYRFYRYPISSAYPNKLSLLITGPNGCNGADANLIKVIITVYRAENLMVFETEPSDALPDIWYENDRSFPIIANQFHGAGGYGIDQTATVIGEIETGFFNCFAFGNGVESYKVRDSIVGRSFNLGNRVTSVSEQDYKASDRFSDITYSGIYNAETNLNNLNVFNAGLLNYKQLETSFGNIYTLDGRETDVLVLQEDKISYVLAGKNLLSDSTGGGAVASVPEVLGTQIARVEKYGISFNPESYVHWGLDRYFTDAKRGVVLQMRGNSYNSDQLQIVSEFGMRTWFRDLFNQSFATQKLGGYDPYMNEYVLCSNDIPTPEIVQCVDCGITRTFTVTAGNELQYCVDLGQIVGDVEITYTVLQNVEGGSFEISSTYDGNTVTSGPTNSSGTLNITKDSQTVTTISINTTSNEILTLQVTVNCPIPQVVTLVEVVLTNDAESGDSIHTQYRYVNGAFVSPLQSNLVTFAAGTSNPLVSRYNTLTGVIGTGGFPPAGSTMTLATNKFSTDSFVFDPTTDKFRYHTSNTFYGNNSVDLNALLAASSIAAPNQNTGTDYNYANFTVPTLDNFLYLIWDFRDSIPSLLCYSETSAGEVCCLCDALDQDCTTYVMQTNTTGTFNYLSCETNEITEVTITDETLYICGKTSYIPQVVSGEVNILSAEAGCVF